MTFLWGYVRPPGADLLSSDGVWKKRLAATAHVCLAGFSLRHARFISVVTDPANTFQVSPPSSPPSRLPLSHPLSISLSSPSCTQSSCFSFSLSLSKSVLAKTMCQAHVNKQMQDGQQQSRGNTFPEKSFQRNTHTNARHQTSLEKVNHMSAQIHMQFSGPL